MGKKAPEDLTALCPKEEDMLYVYVDGSYNHEIGTYAFGCVFLLADGRVYTEAGSGNNPESAALRNVTGEMLGAMFAVRVAVVSGFSKVKIFYDYTGIENWVTGAWKSKTELTKKYAGAMRRWGQDIRISFEKVAAHSDIYYNEMADRLAKSALTECAGMPPVRRLEQLKESHLQEG